VDLYATLFHLRNARNSIPQIAKTLSRLPYAVYHTTWNEQEGVRHRMSSKGEFANWNMRTKFFFIWWNPPPVLLYRATRSVRFHIHYDYLVACLLLPPSNSARRTGRIHTHTNKRIDWLTTTQPPKKGLCEETVTYFNSPVFFHSSIFNGTKDCLPFQAVPPLLQTKITFTLTCHIVKKSKKKWHNPSAFSLQGITKGN
jgi:hypothetical protein